MKEKLKELELITGDQRTKIMKIYHNEKKERLAVSELLNLTPLYKSYVCGDGRSEENKEVYIVVQHKKIVNLKDRLTVKVYRLSQNEWHQSGYSHDKDTFVQGYDASDLFDLIRKQNNYYRILAIVTIYNYYSDFEEDEEGKPLKYTIRRVYQI